MKRIALLFSVLLSACTTYGQPAPYPLTINSQAPTAPQLSAYRASPLTIRVQFMDGANVANLTGVTSNDVFFSWSTSATASTRVAASARIYNATNGQAEFTLAASNLNYAQGRYIYECGVSNAVVRQGTLLITGSPFGTGASPISFATNVNWNLISWVNLPSYITDAPADGSTYGRNNNAWVVASGGGGGSGSVTNILIGGVNNTGNVIIAGGSNITTRSAGGTNYLDGSAWSSLYTVQNGSGLSISQGSGPIAILSVTNSPLVGGMAAAAFATGTPLYVQSETNADARVAKAGDVMTGTLVITNSQLNVYRASGQMQIFEPTGSNALQFNASVLNGPYITFRHESLPSRITYDTPSTSFLFGVSTPPNFTNINNIFAASFIGNGSGLTSVNATNATAVNGIDGTNYVRGVVINGATNRPDSNGLAQLGTIIGGSSSSPVVDMWEVANTITTQIIASSSFSNINFDTYASDNAGRNYNITNDVLTFSSTGLCHVTAAARVLSMSANQRAQMALYRNGSIYRQGIVLSATTNATPTLSVSFFNGAATNQYAVAVQHEDSVSRTLTGGGAAGGWFIWASGYRFRNAGE